MINLLIKRINISFCQIYNDEVYDLLTPVDYSKKLRLKETPKKGILIII